MEAKSTHSEEFIRQPSREGIRIVVYGSLKKNGKLHYAMQDGQARFLGETSFPGRLYSLGPYPAARPAEAPEDVIHGEAYECPDALVERLDGIEGHPWQYKRTLVQTPNFGECEAYIYQRRLHTTDKHIVDGRYNVGDWK